MDSTTNNQPQTPAERGKFVIDATIGIGPRQLKMFRDAFSDFSWVAKSRKEIDEEGKVFTYTLLRGGSWNEAAKAAWEAIGEEFKWTLHKKNYAEIIRFIEVAKKDAEAGQPVTDLRVAKVG